MNAADESGFLSRWARRKADARTSAAPATTTATESPAAAAKADRPAASVASATNATNATNAPPTALADAAVPVAPAPPPATLDDVALLTPASDYTRFVGPEVDPGVRNAAMRKLLSDPQFNVMDGLDVYIDDYGKPDPLPPGMLRQLAQSRFLGLFDDEQAADPAPTASRTAAPDPSNSATDEDPDLRLQPDHAAGAELHQPHRPGPDEDPAGQR